MNDTMDFMVGVVCGLILVGGLAFINFVWEGNNERACEKVYNVYDCEQDNTWYPVYGEELEEELMP